jgi:hypothetical protein
MNNELFKLQGLIQKADRRKFLTNADLLLIAAKIVSMEARHAADIRDLINPNSVDFAGDDLIDANGLE